MKTLRTVEIVPVFCDGDLPLWTTYADNTIYVTSKRDRIGLKCLCGCDSTINLPVNQSPEGWQLEIDDKNRLTLIGSILQHSCQAHYIITKNKANFV